MHLTNSASSSASSSQSSQTSAALQTPLLAYSSANQYNNSNNNIAKNKASPVAGGRLKFLVAIFGSLAVLLVIAVVILSILLNTHINKNASEHELCTTLDCLSHATSLLQYMNTSADPCDDFYEYACGRFDDYQSIPPGKSRTTQFTVLTDRNSKILRHILEQDEDYFVNEAQKKAKQYYEACMDMRNINYVGASTVLKIVNRFGGFYLSENSSLPESWSFMDQLVIRNEYSTSGFFSFSVGQDDKNSSRNLMTLDQGGIGLPARDYYLNKSVDDDRILNAYSQFLAGIATKIIASQDRFDIDHLGNDTVELDVVKDVVRLEQQIAGILASSSERRNWDKMYFLANTSYLENNCPSVNWSQFFFTLASSASVDGLPSDHIVIYGREYFNRLNNVLEVLLNSDDGRRVLHNYIIFRSILKFVPQLSTDFRDLYDTFQSIVTGKKGAPELWETCIMDTSDMLGFALGSVYIRNHFTDSARWKSEEMISEIRMAFKDRIIGLDWMDDETKAKALEKAEEMRYNIGYPDWCVNDTWLNTYYEHFNVTSENLQNHVNYFRYALRRTMQRLREPPDPNRWSMVPMQVNAYYTASQNKIVFPAGILQPPFFSHAVPNALNFGGIGMVIGHEIVHAFDDTGRLFFKNGELRNWWDNVTDLQFRQRAGCISKQYSEFQYDGLNIRGNQTVGENIADNGGIRVAFKAYKRLSEKKKAKELRLPGISLDEDQMFFVNFAQIWCAVYTPEALRHQIMSNAHTPSKYRVLGTVSNSEEFSKAFNCPAKSPMSPHKRCEVW